MAAINQANGSPLPVVSQHTLQIRTVEDFTGKGEHPSGPVRATRLSRSHAREEGICDWFLFLLWQVQVIETTQDILKQLVKDLGDEITGPYRGDVAMLQPRNRGLGAAAVYDARKLYSLKREQVCHLRRKYTGNIEIDTRGCVEDKGRWCHVLPGTKAHCAGPRTASIQLETTRVRAGQANALLALLSARGQSRLHADFMGMHSHRARVLEPLPVKRRDGSFSSLSQPRMRP